MGVLGADCVQAAFPEVGLRVRSIDFFGIADSADVLGTLRNTLILWLLHGEKLRPRLARELQHEG